MHNGCLMYVNPSEHIQQQLFWYGYYEKEAILVWEAFVEQDTIVVDIGANTGYYSMVAAPKARQVFAFEPVPSLRKQLQENISLNKFNNIHIQPYAISAHSGNAILYISGDDNTGMSGLQQPDNFSGKTETADMITLDEWVINNNTDQLNLIKMDTEGNEMNILAGMKNTIEKYHPVIFMEVIAALLKNNGHTPADIYQRLFASGYSAYEPVTSLKLNRLIEPKEANIVIFLPAGFKIPRSVTIID